VREVLAELDADVVGLQEVFAFQRRWLLANASPAGEWADAGDSRGRGGRGEAVPVLWRQDRLAAARRATRWFGDEPERPGSRAPHAGAPRIATWVQLDDADGHRLQIVNTHFDSTSADARLAAAEQLAHELATADDLPTVLLGDFNATLEDPELAPLLGRGLRSALLTSAGPTATSFEHEEGRRLDHVLVSHHWEVTSAEVWTSAAKASDHYPVVADLDLRRPGA
jgi:endonuclease/exonuclease/phosphatase family metal-dependent hydrolase